MAEQADRRERRLGNSTNKHENSNHDSGEEASEGHKSSDHSDDEEHETAAERRRRAKKKGHDGRRPRAVGKTDGNNFNLINVRDGEAPPQTFDKNNSRASGK